MGAEQHALLRGLYCITDPQLTHASPFPVNEMVEQAISGGARIIQYRDKSASQAQQLQTATTLAELCHQHGVLFLVNDDPELARASGADGVHIGQGDASLRQARELLGLDKIIGVTCHNQIDLALEAQLRGADYVAFGRFFPSQTKPQAIPAQPDLLYEARRQIYLPIVAIGGITVENGAQLLAQGADMLAVIHTVFGQPDITQAATEMARLFDHGTEPD